MKRTLFFSLLMLISTSLLAQVGIGTNTPKAILDVVSPTSGMLIPRYPTLAAANTNSLPTLNATDHKGLMIYVAEASNRGFWFYDGSAFVKVGAPINPLPIANGGTGATTAGTAFNALLPAQNGNAGKVLTSDGTNTNWQKPASRTRSISLGVGDFELNSQSIFSFPTKQWLVATSAITFADRSNQTLPILVPIPADWNGTSPFTLNAFYSSAATTGDFFLLLRSNFLSLNSVVPAISSGCSLPLAVPANSSSNGLMQFTITLCGSYSASSKFLEIYISRSGTTEIDSATGDFNLLGMRIDYQD